MRKTEFAVPRSPQIWYNTLNLSEVKVVTVSYKKLWKLLIDRDMTKTELRRAIGASSSTFAKLARGEFISGDLTARICKELHCNVGDIMDVLLDDKQA